MASATLPFVSVSEYLRCSDFEPDAEYVDGTIEERPMGELDHSSLQTAFLLLLNKPPYRSFFRVYPELRIQVSRSRFRVPDVCLLRAGAPKEQIPQTPPLLCIEILSPEDTMSRTMIRVRDFLTMGVPQVWVVDSASRTIHVCAGPTITAHTEGELTVPETSITLSLAEAFSALDE